MRRVSAETARVSGAAAVMGIACGGATAAWTDVVSSHRLCSPALCASQRYLSSTAGGGRGRGSGQDDVSFMQKLRDMYHEFQVSQDRKLDTVASEEAQAGRDRFFDEEEQSGPLRRSTSDKTTSRRRDSPLISRNPTVCPRSVLFVPGSKPRAMEKIASLNADCFILDLEDSVGVTSKRQARENIREFVEGLQRRRQQRLDAQVSNTVNTLLEERTQAGPAPTEAAGEDAKAAAGEADDVDGSDPYPRLIVRINSPDYDPATAMLDLELVGELGPAIEGIAIPKTTPRTYSLIKDYIHPDHQLWAFFEAPKSVIQAPLICKQQVYQYAVMGYNDLSLELQLPMTAAHSSSDDGVSAAVKESMHIAAHLPLWQCTTQVLLAARAHNMFVLDAVFNDPTDKAGFRRSLQECRALGLNGKTLIHPSQIEPTNAAYTPTETDVTWAMRIIEAMEKAHGGVATVDGKMVEELHKRQADRVLALHRSTEAEKQQRAREAAVQKTSAGESEEAGGDSGAAEGTREPRRTPSRHRPLN